MSTCVTVCDSTCFCGEAPLWLPNLQKLLWVDTDNTVCYVLDVEHQECKTYTVDGYFQSAAMISRQGTGEAAYIAPLRDRIVTCGDDFRIISDLGNPLSQKPYMVLGDATVGPDGCLYVGAMNSVDLFSTEGVVLRVRRDLTIDTAAEGFALPNGLAFSSCGSTMYITEMFANRIHAFDFNARTSELSNRRVFADIPKDQGMPDGLIIDAEGYLWSAHWQGFRITRYDPDGAVERIIPVPVPTPTCMAFGGKELTTLYMTTAQKGLSDQQLRDYPESGRLFKTETDIQGRIELKFLHSLS